MDQSRPAPGHPDEEPDVTMTDAGEGGPGEDPDFDEAGLGVPDAPRDEEENP